MHQQELPALDIIIGARASTIKADRANLRAALDKLWQKIAASCVT
jgi:RNase P protein component